MFPQIIRHCTDELNEHQSHCIRTNILVVHFFICFFFIIKQKKYNGKAWKVWIILPFVNFKSKHLWMCIEKKTAFASKYHICMWKCLKLKSQIQFTNKTAMIFVPLFFLCFKCVLASPSRDCFSAFFFLFGVGKCKSVAWCTNEPLGHWNYNKQKYTLLSLWLIAVFYQCLCTVLCALDTRTIWK